METEEIKNSPERTSKEYFNNLRSELTNHLRTELSKRIGLRRRRTRRKKITDFLGKEIWSWFYHYFKSRFGIKAKYKPYPAGETGIYRLTKNEVSANDYMSIALTSDWATDTKESADICQQIRKHEPDYTVHIGDIYFVGAPHEVKKNFVYRRSPWVRGNSGSFAVMGNHEMYARGEAFFEHLLPTLGIKTINGNYDGQKAGFFCLENDHWRILGLDTGYHSIGIPIIEFLPFCSPDARFDKILVDWLKDIVRLGDPNDKRGLVILTHHQFISAFKSETEYSVPAKQLASIIGKGRKIIWLWGHEHKLSLYEKAEIPDDVFVYGRCIGHGGTPIEIKSSNFIKSPKNKGYNKLVMFDNRIEQEIEGTELGFNGYAVLKLRDNELKIEYYDRHTHLLSEKWTADINAGNIKGSIEVPQGCPLKPEQGKAWEDACKE